jgi:hypothetical protein
VRIPRPKAHHYVVAGLLAALAASSLLLPRPVRGEVESSVPTTLSTEPGGLQGLYISCDLLGMPTGRYTGRLEDLDPEEVPVLVVAGEPETGVDPAPILEWVRRGGRLLLATGDARLLGPLGITQRALPGPGTARFDGPGRRWRVPVGAGPPLHAFGGPGSRTGEVIARVGADDGADPWILSLRHGDGTVLLLADTRPLTNEGLDSNADAVLSVRLLEEAAAGGRIRFCETWHGFGSQGSPDRAMARILLRTPSGNAALGAGLFCLLLLLADAGRFGRIRRVLEQPRRSEYEYLEALGGLLLSARAWNLTGRYLLLGVRRRSGRDDGHRVRPSARGIAEALAWNRPEEAESLREGAEALAGGTDPAAMVRALAVLDRSLPPERTHGDAVADRRRKP